MENATGNGREQTGPRELVSSGEKPTHLDLFSDIGGFALAARWAGFRTIGFCEIDKYCQKVLAKNFGLGGNTESNSGGQESSVSQGPNTVAGRIYPNIFDLDGRDFHGVSLITGGFPCQPFSVAGKRRGAADDRAIWPQMFRVISEARPAWVLGENVPGIIPMELDNVLSDLEGIGYATRPFVIPACAVDARHRRQRIWIIGRFMADAPDGGCEIGPKSDSESEHGKTTERESCRNDALRSQPSEGDANAMQQGLEGQRKIACGNGAQLDDTGDHCRWLPEPDVGRVAHGIRSRVDRLKSLGNAIVPQVACEILREIRKLC